MPPEGVGALRDNIMVDGSSLMSLGVIDSGVFSLDKKGEDCDTVELDLDLPPSRGDAPGFCLERFICKHRSGLSRWNHSCRYAPASGPLVILRNPYKFNCL
eukprot:scaffold13659_cov54-Attheya_sp.AAC.2